MTDVTLIEDDRKPGKLIAHRPDCPIVAKHRIENRPIFTLFEIAKQLPPDIPRHDCLKP